MAKGKHMYEDKAYWNKQHLISYNFFHDLEEEYDDDDL